MTQSTSELQQRSDKRGFSVHWSGMIAVGIGAAVCIWVRLQQPGRGAQTEVISDIFVIVCAILFWALGLSWLAFYLSRRNRLVATIVLSVVALLAAAGQVGSMARQRRQAFQDLNTEMAQARQGMVSKQGATPADAVRATGQAIASVNAAAEKVGGNDAVTLKALAGVLEEEQRQMQRYGHAMQKLSANSPLGTGQHYASKDQIGSSRQAIADFVSVNNDLRRFFTNIEVTVAAELDKHQVKQADQTVAINAFMKPFRQNGRILSTMRDQDAQMAADLTSVCDLLENNWGQWQYDAAGNYLFDDPKVAGEFNALLAHIQETASKQEKDQKALFEAMK